MFVCRPLQGILFEGPGCMDSRLLHVPVHLLFPSHLPSVDLENLTLNQTGPV